MSLLHVTRSPTPVSDGLFAAGAPTLGRRALGQAVLGAAGLGAASAWAQRALTPASVNTPAAPITWPATDPVLAARHQRAFAGMAQRIDKPGQFFSRIHVEDIAASAMKTTAREGGIVPIVYGRVWTGGTMINGALSIRNSDRLGTTPEEIFNGISGN